MTPHAEHRLRLIFGLSLVLVCLIVPAAAQAQGTRPPSGTGYYYVVGSGDTWSGISHTVGVPVSRLKAYNPTAVHPNDYLWAGDRLWIPQSPPPTQTTGGYGYTVKKGDTWDTISRRTGVPVQVLKSANPAAAADPHQWLYISQKLWIPSGLPAAAAATETPAPVTTAMPSAGGETFIEVPTPAAVPGAASGVSAATTSQPSPTTTEVPATSAAATVVATIEAAQPTPAGKATGPAATPVPAATAKEAQGTQGSACPATAAAYSDAIAAYLNDPGHDLAGLNGWLTECRAVDDKMGGASEIAAQGVGKKDVAVVIRGTSVDPANPQGVLLVYHSGPKGYSLVHKVEGAGSIKLLKAEDINDDGKPDLVWTDRTCGASTCYSTLFVEAWDGTTFQDWIKGEPTMADAEYAFQDTVPGGSGLEILAHGGVITSAGAGPQRAWTQTYISPEGGPYEPYKQVYDQSDCLYFRILDANELFNKWTDAGFAPAIAAYEDAIKEQSLKACGAVPDELIILRDFARFREMVSFVSSGQAIKALPTKAQITYAPLLAAANAFLDSYNKSHSIVQACREVTKYAERDPLSWQFLADWGYANPSFTAQDLCPLG